MYSGICRSNALISGALTSRKYSTREQLTNCKGRRRRWRCGGQATSIANALPVIIRRVFGWRRLGDNRGTSGRCVSPFSSRKNPHLPVSFSRYVSLSLSLSMYASVCLHGCSPAGLFLRLALSLPQSGCIDQNTKWTISTRSNFVCLTVRMSVYLSLYVSVVCFVFFL